MNTYSYKFIAECPVNGMSIQYNLTLRAKHMIKVEDLIAECSKYPVAFHEDLAKSIHLAFGGNVVLRARHHGVGIVTDIGYADEALRK